MKRFIFVLAFFLLNCLQCSAIDTISGFRLNGQDAPLDSYLVIQKGLIGKHTLVHKFGANPDVDTTTDPEDVWNNGGLYTFLDSAAKLNIVSSDANDVGETKATGTITIADWTQLEAAKANGTITIIDYTVANGSKATGSVEVDDYSEIINGDTLIINGNSLIAGTDFALGSSNGTAAINIGNAINGATTGFTASIDGTNNGLVNLVSTSNGFAFNGMGPTLGNGNGLTATAFSDGRDSLTLTVNGVALVEGTDFSAATSNDVTAEAIVTAIEASSINGNVTVAETGDSSSASATILITSATNGTFGNTIGLVTNNTNGATVSASTLSGGVTLGTLTINGVAFVPGVDWFPTTSNGDTATELARIINFNNGTIEVTAEVSSNVLTLTANSFGVVGNGIALATANANGATVSAATLTGARDNGTGADTIVLEGLSSTWAPISESVILDGTTNVLTINEYLRINRAYISKAGSNEANIGTVTGSNGNTLVSIGAGLNQSQLLVYSVANGNTAYISQVELSATKQGNSAVEVGMYVRPYNGVFQLKNTFGLHSQGSTTLGRNYKLPLKVDQKSDIRFRVEEVSSDNTQVSGSFDLVLVED